MFSWNSWRLFEVAMTALCRLARVAGDGLRRMEDSMRQWQQRGASGTAHSQIADAMQSESRKR
jgi:hypothetical protein